MINIWLLASIKVRLNGKAQNNNIFHLRHVRLIFYLKPNIRWLRTFSEMRNIRGYTSMSNERLISIN